NQDGTYTIAPAADYNGALSLRYDVVDGNGGIAGAMQSITLAAVNDAPTGSATAALAAGVEDTAYTVAAASLLQGFGDVDGDTLSVSNLTADHGTVTDNQDGTYTITPAADYNGTLSLRYDVVDGNGGIAGAVQSITLAAVNDAPTGSAVAALAAGVEDTAYTVAAASLLQGFGDVDGDTLSVSNLTADHGTVTDNQDGTYTIAPAADYNGTLSLRYDVVDGNGGIAGAMQNITLAAINDAPTGSATAALAAGAEDTAYIVAAASLLQGFGDVDGDMLSVSNLTADHGTVTDNQDGTYTITPSADYNGTLSLRYDVVDGNGGIAGAVQSITLAAVNDAPTGSATAALAAGAEDTAYTVAAASLLQGFGDVDGDMLSVANLTADHGTVTDNQDGTYTIAPAADYNGTLSLRYDVVDGNGGIAGAMQSITLAAVNDAPTGSATAALAAGAEDTAYTVAAASLVQGFSDVDGDTLSVSNLTADHGTVTDNQDGTYTIAPTADYNGTLSLRYDVVDGNGGIAGAMQSITLAAINDAPTGSATATLAAGAEDTAYTVAAASLLQGFGDVDGDTLSVANLTADHGTVTDNQDGTYTITPAADYNGTLSLRYDVVDGNGGIAGAVQSITLAAINDAPTIAGTQAGLSVNDDGRLSPFAGVSLGDADSPSQTLTVTISLDDPAKGSLSNLGGGSYTAANGKYTVTGSAAQVSASVGALIFTPTANRVAPGSSETTHFEISVFDGFATTTDAVTGVASDSLNDVPGITGAQASQAVNDNASLSPFAAITLADSDVPAQMLTVTVTLDDAARGRLSQLGGGSYDAAAGVYRISGSATAVTAALRGVVFTPAEGRVAPGFAETTTFAISVSDGMSAANAAASVVSTAIDHAPVAVTVAAATTVDAGALLPLQLAATDADRDSVRFTITSLPAHGSLYADAAGTRPIAAGMVLVGQGDSVTVYYRPDTLWVGSTRFSYTASDPHGMTSAAATVSVNVAAGLAGTQASVPAASAALASEEPNGTAAPSAAGDGGSAATSARGSLAAKLMSAREASAPAAVSGFGEMAAPAEVSLQQPAATVMTASPTAARAETRAASHALAVPALTGAAGARADGAASAETGQQQAGADALASARSGSSRGVEEIVRALEPLRESLKQGDAVNHRVVAASMAVSTGFSVGYVIWLVRGGVLATSLMSSLPIWRFVDPLPVLKNVKHDSEDDDDDSLEDMVRADDDAGDADRMKS
ncbi:cadherin-like domain-containing protein, partial [Noviherbaspirillum soli]|uniref:cadherin-like domain-containing protein n=1 Tax=Noviherbaspirillum soli TaxID=1064518 RepID=UPI00188C4E1C